MGSTSSARGSKAALSVRLARGRVSRPLSYETVRQATHGGERGTMIPVASTTGEFADFVASAEPRLRVALRAAFGFDVGEEATAEALAFAWEHWDRVQGSANPIGYM